MRSYFFSASLLLILATTASPPALARINPNLAPDESLGRHVSRDHRRAPDPTRTGAVSGEVGIASYYWQRQRLASGGQFDPSALTAAHKRLPFGTRVRVRHLGNGRSVDVSINDRGPYVGGRMIDLSKAAAAAIGMTGQGVARVAMTVIGR
jgi:rare lipoprotein A